MSKPGILFKFLAAFMLVSNCLLAQTPVVEFMEPMQGSVQQPVKVFGSDFPALTTEVKVWFGAVEAEVLNVQKGAAGELDYLEVNVPVGASFDHVTVLNTVNNLQGELKGQFMPSFGGNDFIPDALNAQFFFEGTYSGLTVGVSGVKLADLDGDGLADVVATNSSSDKMNFYRNTSVNNSVSFSSNAFVLSLPSASADFSDLNGDGKLDMLIASADAGGANTFFTLTNTSVPGTISFDSKNRTLTNYSIQDVHTADLNEDGKPELILSSRDKDFIRIFLNETTGSDVLFSAGSVDLPMPDGRITGHFDLADFNKDGLLDIVVNSLGNNNLYVYKNESINGSVYFSQPQVVPLVASLVDVRAADLSGDGEEELIATAQDKSIYVFENISNNGITFAEPVRISSSTNGPWRVDLADMDGDGKLDIVTGMFDSPQIGVFRNISDAGGLNFENYLIDIPVKAFDLVVGDVNYDGKPDIIFPQKDNKQFGVVSNTLCYKPEIFGDPEVTTCNDVDVVLVASQGVDVTYVWERTFSGTTSVVGGDSNELTVNQSGSYRVQMVSDDGACSVWSEPVVVTVKAGVTPSSTPNVTGITDLCYGDDLELSGQNYTDPTTTYLWEGPEGLTFEGQVLAISDITTSQQGVYRLSVIQDGCESDQTEVYVAVSSPPALDIQYSGQTVFCDNNSNVVEMTVRSLPDFTYQWYKDGAALTGEQSTTYTATGQGVYQVLTIDDQGCPRMSGEVSVKVYEPLVPDFSAPAYICLGDTYSPVNETTSGGDAVTYNWQLGEVSSQDSNPSITFSEAGVYAVTLTASYEGGNCEASVTKEVTVEILPELTVEYYGLGCTGDSVLISVPNEFASYNWSTGDTSAQAWLKDSELVSLEITSYGGCVFTLEQDVLFSERPVLEVTASQDSISIGGNVQLTASGNGATYQWEPADKVSNPTSPTPLAANLMETTTFTVRAYSEEGCETVETIKVVVTGEVDYTPKPAKYLTPNGDGFNDVWLIENIERYLDNHVKIFDKYGRLIFEENSYRNTFEGSVNGKALEVDAYYYILQYDDGKVLKGSFSLVR